MTFAASANCIRYCGGEVVFCDIDKDTYLMDIRKLEAMLKASPRGTYKGIVPVDFAGYPLDLEEFRKLADEYGLWIIEDACHAPGGGANSSAGASSYWGIPGIQRTGKPWAACRTAIARAWKPTNPIIWLNRIMSRLVKPTSSSWLRERALITEGEPAS